MQRDAAFDEQAVRDQIVSLLPRLRRFAMALAKSPDRADDLVQAACERALGRLHQWTPDTRLDSWMFRIMQTVWIDRCRAESKREGAAQVETMEQLLVGEDGEATAHGRLELLQIRKLIAALPDEQRSVLALVSIEGCSYREAAEILKIPIGTVMSRLARARRTLASAVDAGSTQRAGMVG